MFMTDDWCDVCAALLTQSEKDSNPRYGQCLCDHCNAEYADANPGTEAN